MLPLLRIPLCRHSKSLFICLYLYTQLLCNGIYILFHLFLSLSLSLSLCGSIQSTAQNTDWMMRSSHIHCSLSSTFCHFFIFKWRKNKTVLILLFKLVFMYVENTKYRILCSFSVSLPFSLFLLAWISMNSVQCNV